jgi:hypothetical protein
MIFYTTVHKSLCVSMDAFLLNLTEKYGVEVKKTQQCYSVCNMILLLHCLVPDCDCRVIHDSDYLKWLKTRVTCYRSRGRSYCKLCWWRVSWLGIILKLQNFPSWNTRKYKVLFKKQILIEKCNKATYKNKNFTHLYLTTRAANH